MDENLIKDEFLNMDEGMDEFLNIDEGMDELLFKDVILLIDEFDLN